MLEVGERRNPAETITQYFFEAPREGKFDLLVRELQKQNMESVLVFSRTKHGADKICRKLERSGITSVAIHSNRTQPQRDRALDGFKRGQYKVLVATDIAARGIDVEGISHVVNFDVPQYAEDYIHRIGRTGRAGSTGDAITFVSRDEQQYLKRIERFIGTTFSVKPYDGAVKGVSMDEPATATTHRHSSHRDARPRRESQHQRPQRTSRAIDNSSRPLDVIGQHASSTVRHERQPGKSGVRHTGRPAPQDGRSSHASGQTFQSGGHTTRTHHTGRPGSTAGHSGSHAQRQGTTGFQQTGFPKKKSGPKGKGKNPAFMTTVRKKKAVKKLDSYSTTTSWSNH
jgi:superfamily II DNA/RNA helicase